MKKIFFLLIIISVFAASCKKASKDDSGIQTPLEFVSLSSNDTTLLVNAFIDLTAVAKGDELKYEWSDVQNGTSLSWGSFVDLGNGNAKWTVCHSAKFIITCKVIDKHGNNAEKSISVHVR
ncbi:MAG: hypothetical protein HY951_02050 [Bacteroidia bacterium]|nr:hypothetical protein [Bacteroidia bacterium]